MPGVFKALVSLTVWILFIFGILALLSGFGRIFMGATSLPLITAYFGYGVVSLILSAVAAKIRKTIE